MNAHGSRHDYYVEKITGAKLIDKPGWGGVDSEVLTRRREEYKPPPPPDLAEALTNDKNAFKPGFGGKAAAGPVVPQLSRMSQRRKQEEAAKERAKVQEAKRIAAGGRQFTQHVLALNLRA